MTALALQVGECVQQRVREVWLQRIPYESDCICAYVINGNHARLL